MLAAKDLSKLLAGVPKGAWVAIARDEERVIAFAPELNQVLDQAKENGENDPIVLRVPEESSTFIL